MLTKKFGESFGFKIFRSFAASILAVSLAIAVFFAYSQSERGRMQLIKEGRMLTELLEYSSRAGVFAENAEQLKDPVKGILSQPNVLAVKIYSEDQKLLIHERKGPYQEQLSDTRNPSDRNGALSGGDGPAFEIAEGKNTISFRLPVVLEVPPADVEDLYFGGPRPEVRKNVIGYVQVILTKDALKKEIRSIMYSTGAADTIFLIAGALIIYFILHRATRPLRRLTGAVGRLGMGETVEKVTVESDDEIGRLATSFNIMTENLKKREEEKQALEDKLRLAQKMEAVGTLARGIAHDFNNILTTVQGSVYLMEKRLKEDSPLKHYTGQIHNSINKAKNLVHGLLTFSRIQMIHPVPVEVNTIIGKLQSMLAGIAGEEVQVVCDLSKEPLVVIADPLQVEQVLMNLCSNARDAMPDGGLLTITTEPQELEFWNDREVAGTHTYALISVADTGMGMDEEVKARIFEPFFTTKEVGKGTGLGLSIVYGVIEQHKGLLDVFSHKGEGTVFRIYLPITEERLPSEDNPEE